MNALHAEWTRSLEQLFCIFFKCPHLPSPPPSQRALNWKLLGQWNLLFFGLCSLTSLFTARCGCNCYIHFQWQQMFVECSPAMFEIRDFVANSKQPLINNNKFHFNFMDVNGHPGLYLQTALSPTGLLMLIKVQNLMPQILLLKKIASFSFLFIMNARCEQHGYWYQLNLLCTCKTVNK